MFLGDTVRVMIRDGRLVEDVTLRVRELNVSVGDSGEEDVDLVVGPVGPANFLTSYREATRALAVVKRAAATGTVPS